VNHSNAPFTWNNQAVSSYKISVSYCPVMMMLIKLSRDFCHTGQSEKWFIEIH